MIRSMRGAALSFGLFFTAAFSAQAQHATTSSAPAGSAPEQTCLTWSGGAVGTGALVPCAPGAQIAPVTATISSGGSLSAAVDLGMTRLFAIQMPAAWTTANLTFQASSDNVTFANLYNDAGTEVTVTAAASAFIRFDAPAAWLGIRYIKVRSGTSGSAVPQGADRALTIIGVP